MIEFSYPTASGLLPSHNELTRRSAMAKHDLEHLADTYAVAERFVVAALRSDASLFTPGRPIWSAKNLAESRPTLRPSA